MTGPTERTYHWIVTLQWQVTDSLASNTMTATGRVLFPPRTPEHVMYDSTYRKARETLGVPDGVSTATLFYRCVKD
jgi:hypothetical protein